MVNQVQGIKGSPPRRAAGVNPESTLKGTLGTKMERGIQAELGRALTLLATRGCERERSVHNLYLRKLTGAQGWGRWPRGKQAGIRRAAWRLTSVPGCDGNGGMGPGEVAGGRVDRRGLSEERGLLLDCYSVTTSRGA